jgi:hypothetical protein
LGDRVIVITKEQKKQLSKIDRLLLEDLEKDLKYSHRKYLFWEVIHNTRDFLVFLVVLPVYPIIAIIRAVKSDD